MSVSSHFRRAAATVLMTMTGLASFASAAAPLRIAATSPSPDKAYVRGEWSVDVGQTYDNPFDPKQISVDATFTGPGGRKMVIPAFWRPKTGGQGGAFHVRFAPDQPGTWTLRVEAVDAAGTRSADAPGFTVAAADREPGLIRVADNHRYFRYDNGKTYFPIGINLAWSQGDPSVSWYDQKFADLAANGGNFARVWMANANVLIESEKTGLGRYDETNAQYFDAILESAQKHGIRVELCFLNHRDLLVKDIWGPAGWPSHPYNAKNGGPATRPIDFLTGDAAKAAFKNRLRYVVARYASFTGLGVWELMNEQEFTPSPVPVAWDQEMADYLTAIDPYRRMVSTSAHVPEACWRLPNMAFTQAHLYGDGKQSDLVPSILSSVAEHAKYDKPHLIAEYGIDSTGDDKKFDPHAQGTAFHNAIWSAALSGSAGSAMYWWWDGYVWPKGIYKDFKPLADFVRPIDFAGKSFASMAIPELKRDAAPGRSAMMIPAAGGWGSKMNGPQTLPPNGRPAQAIVTYMVGPGHKQQYAPVEFDIDLPAESKLTFNAGKVSDYAVLRVSVDGRAAGDIFFSATPGSPGIAKPKFENEGGYRADVTEPRTLATPIPAGRHRVTFDVIAGDWVTLSDVQFSDAVDNRYANLAAVAVQDAASKETLAWVFDTLSTWKADTGEQKLVQQTGVTMVVPNVTAGAWSAIWWDTRAGKAVRTDRATAKDGVLKLDVPAFTRDIALRLTPAQ